MFACKEQIKLKDVIWSVQSVFSKSCLLYLFLLVCINLRSSIYKFFTQITNITKQSFNALDEKINHLVNFLENRLSSVQQ